nr:hypothetical protein Iba_chr05dCG11670 [Ipomoea batatas]
MISSFVWATQCPVPHKRRDFYCTKKPFVVFFVNILMVLSLNEQALLTSLTKKRLSGDSLLTEAEALSASTQSRSFTSVHGRGDSHLGIGPRAEVVTPTSAQGRGDARVSPRLRAEVVTPTSAQGRGDARVSPRFRAEVVTPTSAQG